MNAVHIMFTLVKVRFYGITGIYIVHFDHFPPPPLLRFIFSPTNKFSAGGATAGVGYMGVRRPPRDFFILAQKDAFLRPFHPFLM